MTGDGGMVGGIDPEAARLTGRERQVLAGLVAGLTNREIADWLSISESTVKGHTVGIYRTLEVFDRAEAVQAVLSGRSAAAGAGEPGSFGETATAGAPGGFAALPPDARRLATLLGVFRGAFTRDGLAAVAGGVGERGLAVELDGLLRAGAAKEAPGGGVRLAPALAAEAALALEASPLAAPAREAHYRWCAALSQRIGWAVAGPGIEAALGMERMCRLNLVAAFRRELAANRPERAAAILRPLYRIWDAAAVNVELRADIDRLTAQAAAIENAETRSFMLFVAAYESFQFAGRDEALAWVRRLRREAPEDSLFGALAAMCAALFSDPGGGPGPGLAESARVMEERGHQLAYVPRAIEAGWAVAQDDAARGREALAALALSLERAGNDFDRTVPLLQLGSALAACGRLAQARAVNRELIALCRDRGFEHAMYRAMLSQAITELSDDDPALLRTGALVAGATGEMSLRLRVPPGPGWSAAMAGALRQAERRLGRPAVRRLHAEGRTLTEDEAVALALAR